MTTISRLQITASRRSPKGPHRKVSMGCEGQQGRTAQEDDGGGGARDHGGWDL